MRGILRRLVDRYQAARLEADIKYGRKPWGRQEVKMPARATLSVRVIRADGSIEDRGIVSESQVEVTAGQLAELDRAARG